LKRTGKIAQEVVLMKIRYYYVLCFDSPDGKSVMKNDKTTRMNAGVKIIENLNSLHHKDYTVSDTFDSHRLLL
jgi:hypothetical protein